MVTMPSGLPVGTATGRFLFVSEDKLDPDTNPDYTVVTGTVKITCSSKVPLQVSSNNLVVVPLVFEGKFDSDGYLVPANGTGQGIELPASSSDVYNPSGFTWKFEFNLTDSRTGNSVKVSPVNMFIQEGVDNDLADQLPLGPSGGIVITRGEKGDTGFTVVQHGLDGTAERPITVGVVQWVGSARPLNALPYDWWLNV